MKDFFAVISHQKILCIDMLDWTGRFTNDSLLVCNYNCMIQVYDTSTYLYSSKIIFPRLSVCDFSIALFYAFWMDMWRK